MIGKNTYPKKNISLEMALSIIVIFGMFSIYYTRLLTSNYDDLSVLRASAYLSRYSKSTLVQTLTTHLESVKVQLGERVYGRYAGRLSNASAYILHNQLVLFFENLPQVSPYQSVVFASFSMHLISLFLLIAVFFSTKVAKVSEWIILLFLSMLPMAAYRVYQFLPFQREHVWYTPVPRGAALTAFIALFILITFSPISKKKKYVFGILIGIFSFLAHSGAFIVYCLPVFLIIFGEKIQIYKFELFIQKWLPVKIILLFLLLMIGSVAVFYLIMHVFFKVPVSEWYMNTPPKYWAISSIALISSFVILDKFRTNISTQLMKFFYLLSPFICGINLIGISSEQLRWSNRSAYLIIEASERITGLAQFLFWMILGAILIEVVRQKFANFRLLFYSVIFIFGLVGNSYWSIQAWQKRASLRGSDMSNLRASTYLKEFGVSAYDDEVRYFQSVANEFQNLYIRK